MKRLLLKRSLIAISILFVAFILWLCLAVLPEEMNSAAAERFDDPKSGSSLPDFDARKPVVASDGGEIEKADELGFREKIDQLNDAGRDDIDLIDEWAKSSPWDAWKYIVEHKEGAAFARVFEGVFVPMAEQDAGRAAALLAQVPEGSHLNDAYMFLAHYWPQQDIYAAFRWVYQLPDSPLAKTTYESIVTRYAEQSPFEAAVIYEELTDSRLKSVLAASISYHMADQKPEDALAWASALQDPRDKQRALSAALSLISEGAYGDAMTYALEQTEGDLRASLVQSMVSKAVYNESLNRDAGAYSISPELTRKVASLPSIALRDRAWSASSSVLVMHQPETAFNLAQKINDPELKVDALQPPFAQLYSADPAHAMVLLNEAALADTMRNFLLRSVGLKTQELVVPLLEP